MTVVNPKSISGINSITTGSGSDDILTIHNNNGTERLRIDSAGTTKIVTGIVTTLTATTGIVTTLTANTVTSLGAVSGTTGTFSGAISGTTGTFSSHVSLGDSDELRFGDDTDLKLYHDGSNGYFLNSTGNLAIQAKFGEESIVLEPDGRFVAYHNGTEKFSTQSYGIAVDGVVTFTKDADDDITSTLQINGSSMTSTDYNYLMSASNDSGTNFLTMFINGSGRTADGGANGLTIRNDNGPMNVGLNGTTHSTTYYTGLAGGIDFSGHGNAGGMTSELLDDYEEGTFTPTLGGFSSISYHQQLGFYTKIGDAVHFSIYFYVYQATGVNSDITISLPFTSKNDTGREPGAYTVYSNGFMDNSHSEKSNCGYLIGANYSYARPNKLTNGAVIWGSDTHLGQGANNRYLLIAGTMFV